MSSINYSVVLSVIVALQNTGVSKVQFCLWITVTLVIFQQTFPLKMVPHTNVCMLMETFEKKGLTI